MPEFSDFFFVFGKFLILPCPFAPLQYCWHMAYIELMMKLLKGKAFLLKIYILSGQNKDGKIKTFISV
jgi:hypothetical protein